MEAVGDGGPGVLVLAATPIGDVADAPARLGAELARADVVAAEDTRRVGRLVAARDVAVAGRVVSFFEGNEAGRVPGLVERLLAGDRVLLVTDAGTPSVSDPGYRLVAACVQAGVRVTAVPGPSAVTTALAVSGLPVDRFCFEGFLPRGGGPRRRRLAELADEPRTLVLFESPHRLAATLADLADAFGGDRAAAVCRELTKTYEEVARDGLAALAARYADGTRGEVTLVVAGAPPAAQPADDADLGALVAEVERRAGAGIPRRAAVKAVATESGTDRRALYDAVVGNKAAGGPGGPQ